LSETLKNLGKAFIGESQARNRYTFYAKVALKENYPQLSEIFTQTAEQEREHAKQLLLMINDLRSKEGKGPMDAVMVDAEVATAFGDTKANLASAIAGEHHETSEMYPDFAKVALAEGLVEIAGKLRAIAVAEKHHEERYQKFLDGIINGTLWKKAEPVKWICRECGYEHTGTEPPKACPACKHDYWFYQVKNEEY
jgi:rubrerythrin